MAKRKVKTECPEMSHPKKRAFLAAYAECGTITRAAMVAKVDRRSHTRWMESDQKYADAFAAASEEAADNLEEEARRRAHDGLLRLKFHQGQPIIDPRTITPENPNGTPYVEHEYSDTLLIFLLKGARPQKFRDNMDVTSGGKPLVFHPITLDGDKEATS